MQIAAVKKLGVDRIYIGKMTGRSMDRPEFNRMKEVLREGDAVVVWKLNARQTRRVFKKRPSSSRACQYNVCVTEIYILANH